MKKLLIYAIMVMILISSVTAINISSGTQLKPSGTVSTYEFLNDTIINGSIRISSNTITINDTYNEEEHINSYSNSPSVATTYNFKTINISLYDAVTNNSINESNITIGLTGNLKNYELSSENTGNILFNAIIDQNYTVTINADDYAITDESILEGITGNIDFYLYTNNSISFEVRWEENNSLITELTDISLIGSEATYDYNTSNGTHYADNIISGTYSVKASIDGYDDKYYSVTVNDRSHQELTIYFAENYDNVTFIFQDENTGSTLEGVYFSMSRYVNGTLTSVTSKLSDITGTIIAKYVPNTFYSISASKTGYAVKTFNLDPVESDTYIVKLDPSTDQVFIDNGVSIYYTPKTFTNGTNTFNFTFNSPLGFLNSYSLMVSYPDGFKSYTGSNSVGEVFYFDFDITNPSLYDSVKVQYYYITSLGSESNKTYYHTINYINASSTSWANFEANYDDLGIFERIMLVVLAVILVAGFGYLIGGFGGSMIMGLLVYVFFVATGFIPLWTILISLFVGLILTLRGGIFG